MASSSADFDSTQGDAVARRQKKGPKFKFLVPLIYAPILPLIRIGLRRNPVMRERVFFGALAGALAHGAYLMYPFLCPDLCCAYWYTHLHVSLVDGVMIWLYLSEKSCVLMT